MKRQSASSGSGIFLAELLIAILVFSIASAVCTNIFVAAKRIADDSRALNRAVSEAQNGAECFKAAGGRLGEAAALLNAQTQEEHDRIELFFDSGWNMVGEACRDKAEYSMKIEYISKKDGCINGMVSITDRQGMPVYSLAVSAIADMAREETEGLT